MYPRRVNSVCLGIFALAAAQVIIAVDKVHEAVLIIFRYEAELTLANRLLYPSYETVLIPCRDDMSLISSSIVKEVGHYGGDISKMVPAEIVEMVKNKLTERKL